MLADKDESSKAKQRLAAKKQKNKLIIITVIVVIVALVVVGVAGFLFFMMMSDDDDNNNSIVTTTKNELKIPVTDVDDGTVYFFTYKTKGGVEVEYMVVAGTDGKMRTAFNRCDNVTCQLVDAKFTQDGFYLKCTRVGCTYPINCIGTDRANCCVPFPLPHTIEDGDVVIQRSDLEAGKVYFE